MNKIEIAVIGPSFVGKSFICQMIANNSVDFAAEYIPSIGVDLFTKRLPPKHNQKQNFRMYFWDTAGGLRYRSFLSSYIRNSMIVALCFDITEKNTFNELMHMRDFFSPLLKDKQIIVISTKHDTDPSLHQIPDTLHEEIQNMGAEYIKTSSKNGLGIDKFIDMCDQYYIDMKGGDTKIYNVDEINSDIKPPYCCMC